MFEAGVLENAYPLRRQGASERLTTLHSHAYRRRDRRRLCKQYAVFLAQLKDAATGAQALAEPVSGVTNLAPLSSARVALDFAQFSITFNKVHGHYPAIKHIESAYALLHRRIEQVPAREDRVIIAGLAGAALAMSGLQAHLVSENDRAISYLNLMLVPVYHQLGLSVGMIELDMPEAKRRRAYACAITIVSARECAMDFLRDAVNWPQRSHVVSHKIDQLLGKRARQASNLMRGLPCAVLLDADGTLIDNARTPIALTRGANPMAEVDVLKQALEMATYLKRGQHYELTGEGAEIELTDLGHRQLAAWSEQLQGVWGIESIAQGMVSIAIVVNSLIRVGTHYRIRSKAVEWIVDERLVPGMAYYSEDLLSRMVALQQDLELNEQSEVAARASYQQIFNRYVHVCGTCHSLELIEPELRKVYGLKCSRRWPSVDMKPFQHSSFSLNIEQKTEQLVSMLSERASVSACFVLAYDPRLLIGLQSTLEETLSDIHLLNDESGAPTSDRFKAGSVWLVQNQLLEHLAPLLSIPAEIPLTFIVLQRSSRYSEDRRNLYWMQSPPFENSVRVQLLALDDELFSESITRRLKNMVGFSGSGRRARNLEQRIAQLQKNKAKTLIAVRKQLLSHDTTMQGLLSFSGRGLYE